MVKNLAAKKLHRGVIRPTVPTPQTFMGSLAEIAKHLDITPRAASDLVIKDGYTTRLGWRRMTEEEEVKYYTPPVITKKKVSDRLCKRFWKVTLFKDWKKGDPYVTDKDRVFTGSPPEFARFVDKQLSQVYKILNTHLGTGNGYGLRTIDGWCPVRVRKYKKPYERRSLKEIRGG